MITCHLPDRGIVAVGGPEAEGFLNRLFTRSMLGMRAGEARYGALLSPQGKLLFDFLVYRRPDLFWIDVPRAMAADFARKLTLFRLRAKVEIAVREDLQVGAVWDGALLEAPGPAFRDPRHDALGYRIVATAEALAAYPPDIEAYDTHRIRLGIPVGGVDFPYGDTFVHDANLDLLHGVDFDKGCYVGQEVVSRVQHRGSARKRIVRLQFEGDAPAPGAPILAGDTTIGTMTSRAGAIGLGMVRLDRLDEAEAAHEPIRVGTIHVGTTLVTVDRPVASAVTPADYAVDLY